MDRGNSNPEAAMNREELNAPFSMTEWPAYIAKSREAGYDDETIRASLNLEKMFRDSAVTDAFRTLDDEERKAELAAEKRREESIEYMKKREARVKAAKMAKAGQHGWTRRPTAEKVYRRINADDASVHGSQYLGREGQMAWMPR